MSWVSCLSVTSCLRMPVWFMRKLYFYHKKSVPARNKWDGGGDHSVHEAAETPECVRVVLHYCVDDG